MLKNNILANYAGQIWRVIMAVGLVPAYINLMGIEAFGLVGIFAILQAWISLLDMGLRPAVAREMAKYTGDTVSDVFIHDLLRTIELITVMLALIIVSFVYIGSEWFVENWVNFDSLDKGVIRAAFILMGFILALNFLESLYSSCLSGLQKQVDQNIILILVSSMKGLGSILVLSFLSPTIIAFFSWQAICVIVSILSFRVITYRRLPKKRRKPEFSWLSLSHIYKFAGGMLGITVVSLLLTQLDKIILSKYVNLEEFGYFTLAFTVTNALYTFVTPVSQAFLPRLTQLVAQNSLAQLSKEYHLSSQIVTAILGSSAIILLVNSQQIIFLWTLSANLTDNVSYLVTLLTIGTLFNCIMWIPFQLQLAYGWTSLSLKLNLIAVIILIPTLIMVVPRFGSIGVAWIYIILNFNLLFFGVMFMHRKLLTEEKYKWLIVNNIIPLIFGLFVCLSMKFVIPIPDAYALKLMRIILITICTFTTIVVLCSQVRYFTGSLILKFYRILRDR